MHQVASWGKSKTFAFRSAAVIAVVVGMLSVPFQPAMALDPDPPQSSFDSYGSLYDPSHPPSPCGFLLKPFTGNFALNPCDLTRENKSLDYAQQYFGGQQFSAYLEGWWNDEMVPILKKMVEQLHASRDDQTRQLGTTLDAQSLAELDLSEKTRQVDSQLDTSPSELTCVAGSSQTAMSQTSRAATALTSGFKEDLNKRSANAPDTAAEAGPVANQKIKWDTYCAEFQDPDSNNGQSACPNAGTPGQIMNGDIDIEGLLFKDTIDFMTNPHQYKAAIALLENLTQPTVKQKIPEDTINTVAGRQWILTQQHIQSARNIATDVIASIISRRIGIPGTNVGTTLQPLRVKAGIDPAKTSLNPSYNEIMLTMTKERFYDPEYFVRMQDHRGAVKQEEASLNTYINMQYEDIYKLQEQINALLAARAALKFNADDKPSPIRSSPLK